MTVIDTHFGMDGVNFHKGQALSTHHTFFVTDAKFQLRENPKR